MNPNDQPAVPNIGGQGESPGNSPAPSSGAMPQPPQMPPQQQYSQQSRPQGRPANRGARPGGLAGLFGGQAGSSENQPDHQDDVWVDRAKRAIAETQNDPHRQVQLLQHLNRLYLKERFNRDVHAEDGTS